MKRLDSVTSRHADQAFACTRNITSLNADHSQTDPHGEQTAEEQSTVGTSTRLTEVCSPPSRQQLPGSSESSRQEHCASKADQVKSGQQGTCSTHSAPTIVRPDSGLVHNLSAEYEICFDFEHLVPLGYSSREEYFADIAQRWVAKANDIGKVLRTAQGHHETKNMAMDRLLQDVNLRPSLRLELGDHYRESIRCRDIFNFWLKETYCSESTGSFSLRYPNEDFAGFKIFKYHLHLLQLASIKANVGTHQGQEWSTTDLCSEILPDVH
jgi:hypothetical protein